MKISINPKVITNYSKFVKYLGKRFENVPEDKRENEMKKAYELASGKKAEPEEKKKEPEKALETKEKPKKKKEGTK